MSLLNAVTCQWFGSIFVIMFVPIVGMIILGAVKQIKEYRYNNTQPILPVPCTVADKEEWVSEYHYGDDEVPSTTTTHYSATFVFDNGQQMELSVPSQCYYAIRRGDRGILSLQGSRFIGFQREPRPQKRR